MKNFIYGILAGILVFFCYNNPQIITKTLTVTGQGVIYGAKGVGNFLQNAFIPKSQAIVYQVDRQIVQTAKQTAQEVKVVSKKVAKETQTQVDKISKQAKSFPKKIKTATAIAEQKVPKTTISIVTE